MRIDFPTPEQEDALVCLWQESFGDERAWIRRFFRTAFSPSRCRCALIDGETAAMLYWFDAFFRGQRFAYLYAVAVKPDHRGKGVCTRLMADTHAHLSLRGYAGAMLVPENLPLRRMYAAMGYGNCTQIREFSCPAGDDPLPLEEIDGKTYAALRRRLLPEGGALQEEENIACLETMCRLYRGEDVLAAVQAEGERLRCVELLGNADAAPGIVKALGCREGQFRTPGRGRDFAMLLPLKGDLEMPGYFGLAFD